MQATIYNMQGAAVGETQLPEAVFGAAWNRDLVHQVVTAMEANARHPIAHTKTRGEVSGTGKKPWRQKGTGSARHGSRRSPIWRTGGVAHGPRNERSFTQRINKQMRTRALYAVLSKKFADGEVLFVDALTFSAPKTRDALAVLHRLAQVSGYASLATKRRCAALIAAPTLAPQLMKSFQNFGNVAVEAVRNLNPVELLRYKYLILAAAPEAIQVLAERGAATREA